MPAKSFQSTLPARGATPAAVRGGAFHVISIHAPRTGSDSSWGSICAATGHFNPRSPHGERRQHGGLMRATQRHFNPRSPHGERRAPSYAARDGFLFQSTLPARGATVCVSLVMLLVIISIHAPRTGSDGSCVAHAVVVDTHFNPRSPHGERRHRQQAASG